MDKENKPIEVFRSKLSNCSREVQELQENISDRFREIEILTGMYVESTEAYEVQKRAYQIDAAAYEVKLAYLRAQSANESNSSKLTKVFNIFFRDAFRLRKSEAVLSQTDLFDGAWYLGKYKDVEGSDYFSKYPLRHYLLHGHLEFRDPGPRFSSLSYLTRYPDVASTGINPLLHYVVYGRREGRMAISKA